MRMRVTLIVLKNNGRFLLMDSDMKLFILCQTEYGQIDKQSFPTFNIRINLITYYSDTYNLFINHFTFLVVSCDGLGQLFYSSVQR